MTKEYDIQASVVLYKAVRAGDSKLVKLALDEGGDPNMVAHYDKKNTAVSTLYELVDTVSYLAKQGEPALEEMITVRMEILDLLLAAGADPKMESTGKVVTEAEVASGDFTKTPLEYAREQGLDVVVAKFERHLAKQTSHVERLSRPITQEKQSASR